MDDYVSGMSFGLILVRFHVYWISNLLRGRATYWVAASSGFLLYEWLFWWLVCFVMICCMSDRKLFISELAVLCPKLAGGETLAMELSSDGLWQRQDLVQ